MPVDNQSKKYKDNANRLSLLDDVLGGEDRMKEAKSKYVPRLTDQTDSEYNAYIKRGSFFNATARTQSALVGAIFRKPPQIEIDKSINDISIGSDGSSLKMLISKTASQVIGYGRSIALLDRPVMGGDPYISIYDASQLINWRTTTDKDGKTVLSFAVLKEEIELQDPQDEFKSIDVEFYRVLRLRNNPGDSISGSEYVYTVEVWNRMKGSGRTRDAKFDLVVPEFAPNISELDGEIDYIPIIVFGPKYNSFDTEKSPLYDMAVLNVGHWRDSVDIQHGLHMTALPTPWASGLLPGVSLSDPTTKPKVQIGPGAFLLLPENARAGMIEFNGSGIKTYMVERSNKQQQMAILGARMIEESRQGVETAEHAKIRQSGESSTLLNIADAIGSGYATILDWYASWVGVRNPHSIVELNKDFIDSSVKSHEIIALMQLVQAGAMSQETFMWNLQQGELLPPHISIEEELERISSDDNSFLGGNFGETPDGRKIRREGSSTQNSTARGERDRAKNNPNE